jgi:hypothetical protein
VADGELGDLLAAVGVPHGGDQLAHLDFAAAFGHRVHACLEALLDGLHHFVEREALLEVLLRCPADFTVDHAVIREVLHEFLGDPEQAFLGLHHGNGVVESLKVADQGAGVCGLSEPLSQRSGVG